MEFENENGTANTWWAGMVTQYNPTNDQYAAFFPSDHTSRQMIKTIALFPRTLIVTSGLTEQILLNNIQEPKYNIQTGLLYKTSRLNITHKVSTR